MLEITRHENFQEKVGIQNSCIFLPFHDVLSLFDKISCFFVKSHSHVWITFKKQFFSHVFKNVRPWQTDQPHIKRVDFAGEVNFEFLMRGFFPSALMTLYQNWSRHSNFKKNFKNGQKFLLFPLLFSECFHLPTIPPFNVLLHMSLACPLKVEIINAVHYHCHGNQNTMKLGSYLLA